MPLPLLLAPALALIPSPPQCTPAPVDQWFPDPGTHVEFGLEVAMSGEWAVVGACLDDPTALLVDAGAAYVYRRTTLGGWAQHSKITADDAAAGDEFGIDVDIDGETIVVGARSHSHAPAYWADAGAAYVFELIGGQWRQSTELLGSDMQPSVIEFGSKVGVSGDTVVVSSEYDDASCGTAGTECGAAYVYVEPSAGWSGSLITTEVAKLVSATLEDGSRFGCDVRVDGTTIVVGALRENSGGVSDSGAAYVFEEPQGGWGAATPSWTRIVPCVPKLQSEFGVRVDVQGSPLGGDRVVIGSPKYEVQGGHGAAFVVEEPLGGWPPDQEMPVEPNLVSRQATVSPRQDTFGIGVALDGDWVVIGAPTDDPPHWPGTGRAYVFRRLANGTWFEAQWLQAKLVHSPGTFYPYLGGGLAIEGNSVLVGAHLDDNAAGPDAGTVLVYDLSPCFQRRW